MKNEKWIQQADCWERRELSKDLVMLSFVADASPKKFSVQLREFVRDFQREGRKASGDRSFTANIRHIKDDEKGRQYFVIYLNGEQFDYFEYSNAMVGGGFFDD